jgi:hypothetical protein
LNSDNLSRWISAAANIAVLAGLVLVAIQISQNSSLARTALINEGNVVSNQIWANLMGENPGQVIARAIECPERMTYADFMAMDAFLFSNMNMLYRDYQLTQEGLFTSSDWKASVDAYAHWYLGNTFGRVWWDQEARHFFNAEFTEYVDKRLQEDGMDSHTHWERIRARVVVGSTGQINGPCVTP